MSVLECRAQSTPRASHPPLRRISCGTPLLLNPADNAPHPFFSGRDSTPLESHDSCYSSCSEESHSSLSREPSDTLASETSQLSVADEGHLEFATKLGYTEAQLQLVLDKIGHCAGQDQVLSELIKLGKSCSDVSSKGTTMVLHSTPALRSIVIDGSNIAMTHGRKEVFSCAGIRDCVQFFRDRGHTDVLVFVPQFRREAARSDCPITDQHILIDLESEGVLVWTPSRRIGGRRIVCHDDRYILKTAEEKDAVIVSNDEYRDLIKENSQYRKLVEQRLLMYSFVDGKFMPPDDPLGRHGPKLAQFLSKGSPPPSAQLCPYGRKCTYGNKCKYFHPERPNGIHVSVTERLMKEKQQRKQCLSARPSLACDNLLKEKSGHAVVARTRSLNFPVAGEQKVANDHHMGRPRLGRQPRLEEHADVHTLVELDGADWPHAALMRNLSAPIRRSPPLAAAGQCCSPRWPHSSRSNSACNLASQVCFTRPPPSLPSSFDAVPEPFASGCEQFVSSQNSSHLFAPSTAVWGESEFCVGPLTRPSHENSSAPHPEDRMRLQQLLCQLFSESAVIAVMGAHPDEVDPQKLCARILEFQKGFNS